MANLLIGIESDIDSTGELIALENIIEFAKKYSVSEIGSSEKKWVDHEIEIVKNIVSDLKLERRKIIVPNA